MVPVQGGPIADKAMIRSGLRWRRDWPTTVWHRFGGLRLSDHYSLTSTAASLILRTSLTPALVIGGSPFMCQASFMRQAVRLVAVLVAVVPAVARAAIPGADNPKAYTWHDHAKGRLAYQRRITLAA